MKIDAKTMRASPFVGVFCVATDKHVLIPLGIEAKERKGLEDVFDAEVIPTSLASSGLLGVLCIANSNGYCVSNIATEKEIRALTETGLHVKRLSGVEAIGNLAAVNDRTGFCSAALGKKVRNEIQETLKVHLNPTTIAGTDVVGSALVLTNTGFICHPNTRENEFSVLQEHTAREGRATSANQGDLFVGNSVVANAHGAIVGSYTTGHELLRIDEGLRNNA